MECKWQFRLELFSLKESVSWHISPWISDISPARVSKLPLEPVETEEESARSCSGFRFLPSRLRTRIASATKIEKNAIPPKTTPAIAPGFSFESVLAPNALTVPFELLESGENAVYVKKSRPSPGCEDNPEGMSVRLSSRVCDASEDRESSWRNRDMGTTRGSLLVIGNEILTGVLLSREYVTVILPAPPSSESVERGIVR